MIFATWRLALAGQLGLAIVLAAFVLSALGYRLYRDRTDGPIYLLLMLACVPALVWFSLLVSPLVIPPTLIWRVASRAVMASPFVAISAIVWIRIRS